MRYKMTCWALVLALGTSLVASENNADTHLSSSGHTFVCWLNGWRKTKGDYSQAIFGIEASGYNFTFDVSNFSKAGFAPATNKPLSYVAAVSSGTEKLKALPASELIIEIEGDGKIYKAVDCKAGRDSDDRRLSTARMWESGRWVQHYDFLDLKFADKEGNKLQVNGTLDLVAWPDSLTLTALVSPENTSSPVCAWKETKLRVHLKGANANYKIEKSFDGPWGADARIATLEIQAGKKNVYTENATVEVEGWNRQTVPVKFDTQKNCFVASAQKLKRDPSGDYNGSIKDYDDFKITIENKGSSRFVEKKLGNRILR